MQVDNLIGVHYVLMQALQHYSTTLSTWELALLLSGCLAILMVSLWLRTLRNRQNDIKVAVSLLPQEACNPAPMVIPAPPTPTIDSAMLKLWEDYIRAGDQAFEQGHYRESGELFESALRSAEIFGSDSLRLAHTHVTRARVHRVGGNLERAGIFLKRARATYEAHPPSTELATCLNEQATLRLRQGDLVEAEKLSRQALSVLEKRVGLQHYHTAECYVTLGCLNRSQKKYDQADILFKLALKITKETYGAQSPRFACLLDHLALSSLGQGKYSRAEQLLLRAQQILEKYTPDHPVLGTVLFDLGNIYIGRVDVQAARHLQDRARLIWKRAGAEPPPVN